MSLTATAEKEDDENAPLILRERYSAFTVSWTLG